MPQHHFQHALSQLQSKGYSNNNNNNKLVQYFDLQKASPESFSVINKLPLSIKILLEMVIRKCDGTDSGARVADVQNVINWQQLQGKVEVPFWPARVLMQDFTGVPAVADLAAMRDAVSQNVADEATARDLVNPLIPIDLVIDHSIQAIKSGSKGALQANEVVEMEQNAERFELLRWASKSFRNFRIVPPGSGIVHQVNLELLARVAFSVPKKNIIAPSTATSTSEEIVYPDTLVGTDSHTTMVNGIGCLGWGVGGIEAEAAMLGEPLQLLLPQVVGVRITGTLPSICTATDVVLRVVSMLRQANVVGQFVEFYGDGVAQQMSAADRATISNMAPEYGATCGLFAVDDVTLEYLMQTGRGMEEIDRIRSYFKAAFGFHDAENAIYTRTLHLDLATVTPSLAGPKRPQDLISLSNLKSDFNQCLAQTAPGHKSFAVAKQPQNAAADASGAAASPSSPSPSLFSSSPSTSSSSSSSGTQPSAVSTKDLPLFFFEDPTTRKKFQVDHGMVVLAAITSCTNTSNPDVMIGAGLLARNARRAGLASVKPYVKTSLSPGSRVVTQYLTTSGLLQDLEALGFYIAGYGCMTCIGNSGPLLDGVSEFVREHKLVASAVLSGNRNFEGRVHPDTLANYLASPPLVVAAALAGTVNIDFDKEPIGYSAATAQPVFLKDIWPDKQEIRQVVQNHVTREAFEGVYMGGSDDALIWKGNDAWRKSLVEASLSSTKTASSAPTETTAKTTSRFQWNTASTYIQPPPFLSSLLTSSSYSSSASITNARCLLFLGDSVTTDHISPAGSIATHSDAGAFLTKHGVPTRNFNSYGSRRGNDLVMVRGTFANVRLANKLVAPNGGATGPRTIHYPSNEVMSVFEASERYKKENGHGVPLVVIAGKEYGSGSSRDWAAKGPALLGVKVVIAESYERIHRSNLVGMGILPLQFMRGESAASVGLTGREVFSVVAAGPEDAAAAADGGAAGGTTVFHVSTDTGISFKTISRVDTAAEAKYMKIGGILPFVVSKLIARGTQKMEGLGKL